MKVAITFDVNF